MKKYLTGAYSFLTIVCLTILTYNFFSNNSILWLQIFSPLALISGKRAWVIITQSLALLFIIVYTQRLLKKLEFNLLHKKFFAKSGNINFLLLKNRVWRYPFTIMLFFNLPQLAFIEEWMFRDGFGIYPTINFMDALMRSLLFGATHCLTGQNILTGFLVLPIGGLWFSYQYFEGDLLLATFSHFTYNILAIFYLLGKWYRTKEYPF